MTRACAQLRHQLVLARPKPISCEESRKLEYLGSAMMIHKFTASQTSFLLSLSECTGSYWATRKIPELLVSARATLSAHHPHLKINCAEQLIIAHLIWMLHDSQVLKAPLMSTLPQACLLSPGMHKHFSLKGEPKRNRLRQARYLAEDGVLGCQPFLILRSLWLVQETAWQLPPAKWQSENWLLRT